MGTELDASVVLLTHYVPLYQVRVYQELSRRFREFRILLSTAIEPNRKFDLDWQDLDITVQKSWMLRRRWRHSVGFDDPLFIHVPYGTLGTLRKLKPDVVLAHELGARSIVAAGYRQFAKQSRLVLLTYMSEHTEQGRGRLRGVVRSNLLKRADAVTYNGPSCLRYLKQFKVDEECLFSFPYAADDRIFSGTLCQRNESDIRHRLICVGQLSERKGVLLLTEQLSQYCGKRKHQKLSLTLVGQGPLRDQILALVRPENFELQIIENLTPTQLFEMYKEHSAAIHGTLADEWLMVVNESLHAGLPMIGSQYAQAVETLVRDDFNGWCYDPMQTEDVGSKLDLYFSKTDAEISQMRKNAIESVADRTPAKAAAGIADAVKYVTRSR